MLRKLPQCADQRKKPALGPSSMSEQRSQGFGGLDTQTRRPRSGWRHITVGRPSKRRSRRSHFFTQLKGSEGRQGLGALRQRLPLIKIARLA